MKICMANQDIMHDGKQYRKGEIIPNADEKTMAAWAKNKAVTILEKGMPKQPAKLKADKPAQPDIAAEAKAEPKGK